MDVGGTGLKDRSGSARTPWYRSGSFWTGRFTWIISAVATVAITAAWFVIGGVPRDHDAYGTVGVPGTVSVELPDGDVRLNFENEKFGARDENDLAQTPDDIGLEVTITPAAGGEPLGIDSVPSWYSSSINTDRAWETYAKVDAPDAGTYVVTATDESSAATGAPPVQSVNADDYGPQVAIGKSPWAPLGSPLVGAILSLVAIAMIAFGISAFGRYMRGLSARG